MLSPLICSHWLSSISQVSLECVSFVQFYSTVTTWVEVTFISPAPTLVSMLACGGLWLSLSCPDAPMPRNAGQELLPRHTDRSLFQSCPVITPVWYLTAVIWFVGNLIGCACHFFRNYTWNPDAESRYQSLLMVIFATIHLILLEYKVVVVWNW